MNDKSKRVEELKVAASNGTLVADPERIAASLLQKLLSNAKARRALALINR